MAPSGVEFNLVKPDPASIHIEDIAHHLSQICRFTGGTREHYSVAQHSVLVAQLVPLDFQLAALLHDAAEAYVGDVSRPLKTLIGRVYAPIEERILQAIFEKFGVPALFAKKLPMVVKRADRTLLAWEQRDLMPAMTWRAPVDETDLVVELETLPDLIPMSAEVARRRFLARLVELTA